MDNQPDKISGKKSVYKTIVHGSDIEKGNENIELKEQW
jgi:hypothetical protein